MLFFVGKLAEVDGSKGFAGLVSNWCLKPHVSRYISRRTYLTRHSVMHVACLMIVGVSVQDISHEDEIGANFIFFSCQKKASLGLGLLSMNTDSLH